MNRFSFLNHADPSLIEDLYEHYKEDPTSVESGWRWFFEGFEFSQETVLPQERSDFRASSEFKVITLIDDYRKRGHLFTKTNPVRTRRKYSPTLAIENYGLTPSDLDEHFEAGQQLGIGKATLREIIDFLNKTYCQSIGVEYVYIRDTGMVEWLRSRMEGCRNTPSFTRNEKNEILRMLTEAVDFENFIHKRFPGQKRFSLEGAETLIPALNAIIEKGSDLGVEEYVIGNPHRGRLNVLANILKKSYEDIFLEFEGKEYDDETLLGDVKYHVGFTSVRYDRKGHPVRLTLSPNSSHLESVDAIVEGVVRSRSDNVYHGDVNKIVPILIHGDASIAGQGVVYEVIQMSGLNAYQTGGTVHLVVNNQLGFTTNYLDGRTSTYCTDVGKTIQSPIFHVNADDAEAVVYALELAMDFRMTFHKDVFVDLLGYRRYGHNEGDEPRFTQPLLYKVIEKHPNPREIYLKKLMDERGIDIDDVNVFEKEFHETLEKSLIASKEIGKEKIFSFLEETWKDIRKAEDKDFESSPVTAVGHDDLVAIGEKISTLPSDKSFFRKTIKLQNDRMAMIKETGLIDWAMAELLAFGTLLQEGTPIRFNGQDSQRGTFSQRHAVITLQDSEEKYIPLSHISERQGRFEIYNSLLSEYAALGFEYGYALASPYTLTIWEAQYGDFSNGAQIVFDQYLSSAEEKWNNMNGLVVLLPHGYEGQGPEHSSGRIERFLTLCAENNMQIANCTTPANYFHLLRRQMHRAFRKPLVVFTPKSLLRHPQCISPLSDFTTGGFKELIDDNQADPAKIIKVVLCTGKVYYDLLEEKEKIKAEDVAFIRLEQLFPLPLQQIKGVLKKYNHARRLLWVQEEPVNMGAWMFIHQALEAEGVDLKVISRPASGSPATGSSAFHYARQRKIVSKTFNECDCYRIDQECKMVCLGNEWRKYLGETDSVNKNRINVKQIEKK